ncbi:Exosome complex component RRP42 [Taenia crassiceps]|uniref:Ribosomal RNA-processing protein 42 n=1 Tax=Taenia crassiceps TaxID=6207 RepID=A0ABR4QPC7_9CEST
MIFDSVFLLVVVRIIMDNTLISDAERFFIIQGAQLGCRLDGRQRNSFRPIELETDILNHTAGSARVKIGNTIVIACVSMEISTPSIDAGNAGRIEIDVECSPAATPRFSGKSGSDIADTLKATLSTAFTRECLPFKLLCIQPGKQCWVIHADILLLESAGNLLDAASLAIVAALSTIKLPLSLAQKIAAETGDTSCATDFALSITNIPLFTTVHKVGNSYIVDADKEEEACTFARIFVAVLADGTITAIIKEGCGSLQIDSLMDMIEIGQSTGKEMHAALASALQQEHNMKSSN